MSHLVRNERWGVVDLDPDSGRVFVREDWRYEWKAATGLREWTPGEKRAYHHALDRLVWARWSKRAMLRANLQEGIDDTAAGALAVELSKKALSLTFDVRWVASGGHWAVTVNRADPAAEHKPRAKVDTDLMTIKLFDIDVVEQHASRPEGAPHRRGHFYISAHEFGHTLLNRDEYWMTSPHFRDIASIMNIGQGLRPRHFKLVVDTLHKMVPGCTFTATL